MYHLQQAGTPTAKKLQRDIYVNNLITGVRNVKEAKSLCTESKTLLSSASMNLREWGLNSREFINSIGEKDRAPTFTSKMLGIIYDCEKDLLVVPEPTYVTGFHITRLTQTQNQTYDFTRNGLLV